MHDRASACRRGPAAAVLLLTLVAGPALAAAPEADTSEADANAADTSEADASEADASEADANAADANAADANAADANAADANAAEAPGPAEPEATAPTPAPPDAGTAPEPEAPRPPRIDGTYLGTTVYGGLGLVRVNTFDTPGPFATFGGTLTVGQMVFPWLGLGLHGGGGGGVRSEEGARQILGQGHLGVQFTFVPLPKRLPLSLRTSFGFGGGAARQVGVTDRAGFGGAQFSGAVRYELFPWAARRRPYRGGGFGLGPEVGWLGFTPAAAGRPMSNVLYVALATTFYFGS